MRLKEKQYGDYTCGIFVPEESTISLGSYVTQNAYGAAVTVQKYKMNIYHILWSKPEEGSLFSEGKPVYIDVPIDRAKHLKNKMQLGYVVNFKDPYFTSWTSRHPATYDKPEDVVMTTHKIITELLCVVVTDDNNQVLKAFEPYQ